MGIYTLKSSNCECKGTICTLTADHRIYMSYPCVKHEIKTDNIIYYELSHLFNHITKHSPTNIISYEPKYLVKVLDVKVLARGIKLVKVELVHNGSIHVSNFNETKNIIYSQWDDEPMWKKIDENTIHIVLLYQGCHHNVENSWEPLDF